MDIDYFIHDNVDYYRLFAMDPTCLEVNIPSKGEFWYHADDNCGGDIYIGNNCHLLCRKCMKEVPLNIVGWVSPYSSPNIFGNLISFDGHVGKKCLDPISILGQCPCGNEFNMIWAIKLTEAAIRMYDLT